MVVCLFCAPAFSQIYYLPVQYQYHNGTETFYYGGRNPYLFNYALRESAIETIRTNNGVFNHRFQRHAPVYSDVLPYRDMTDYGFTAADAANEAYANVPRYFRKADLLRAAIPQADGSWVVPADARPVEVIVDRRPIVTTSTRPIPQVKKGEIIIIPKKMLDRPLKDFVPREKPPVAMSE